jgi:hypothetical protein
MHINNLNSSIAFYVLSRQKRTLMKILSPLIVLFVVITVLGFTSCKKDDKLSVPGKSLTEEFDTLLNAYNRGWRFINRSIPIGRTNWQQGSISGDLTAYSSKGTNEGFVSSDYAATSADVGVISNWIVSPSLTIQNGDKIIFYTRAVIYPVGTTTDSTDYSNRLQVRINTTNDSLKVGNGSDAGLFDKLLLDINPAYAEYHTDPFLNSPNAFPARWTRYEATVSGLSKPAKGRFALRYFIEQGGISGRGSEIGVDSVAYVSTF